MVSQDLCGPKDMNCNLGTMRGYLTKISWKVSRMGPVSSAIFCNEGIWVPNPAPPVMPSRSTSVGAFSASAAEEAISMAMVASESPPESETEEEDSKAYFTSRMLRARILRTCAAHVKPR